MGAEGSLKWVTARRRRAVYENLRIFEKFRLKNGIRMNLGDLLNIFLDFSQIMTYLTVKHHFCLKESLESQT